MAVGRSRRQQVLDYLQARAGQWVNGPELANETVGGSEGLKRLRELRAEGYPILERKHPDQSRTIWQYRLSAATSTSSPERSSTQTDSPTTSPSDLIAQARSIFEPER